MENNDLILFAIDQHLTNVDKRIVPVELLNLQRLVDKPTELEKIQGIINSLEAELSKYGYHIWMSTDYIKKDTEK